MLQCGCDFLLESKRHWIYIRPIHIYDCIYELLVQGFQCVHIIMYNGQARLSLFLSGTWFSVQQWTEPITIPMGQYMTGNWKLLLSSWIHHIALNCQAYSCICTYVWIAGSSLSICVHVYVQASWSVFRIDTSVSPWQWTQIVLFAVPMGRWQVLTLSLGDDYHPFSNHSLHCCCPVSSSCC